MINCNIILTEIFLHFCTHFQLFPSYVIVIDLHLIYKKEIFSNERFFNFSVYIFIRLVNMKFISIKLFIIF